MITNDLTGAIPIDTMYDVVVEVIDVAVKVIMAKKPDNTAMGGEQGYFETTHWSMIRDAKTLNETRRTEVVNSLIQKYWKPVYCYLRRKGHSNEAAKDMTQGFFYEVALTRNLIGRADKAKGKFRTFLLTALDRYTHDVHDREKARKRNPEGGIVPIGTDEMANLLETQKESDPTQVFHFAWASEVLDQVLDKVKKHCCNCEKEKYWQVFHAKVVVAILESCEPPPLKELCKNFGIESEAKASNMIAYVKGQFRTIMMRHLRQSVESDAEVEEEYNEILNILSKKSTR